MIIIGIDPGNSGAIAIRDGRQFDLCPMPRRRVGTGSRMEIDGIRVSEILAGLDVTPGQDSQAVAYIESQQAMPPRGTDDGHSPGQGVVSSFRTGDGYGLLRGVCIGMGIRVETVSPRRWRSRLFDVDQDDALAWCEQRWPGYKIDRRKAQAIQFAATHWPWLKLTIGSRGRKPHDGLADAVCISEYGVISEGMALTTQPCKQEEAPW